MFPIMSSLTTADPGFKTQSSSSSNPQLQAHEKSHNPNHNRAASLKTTPVELLIQILGHLDNKRDWAALARTCRRISHITVPELDKYNFKHGKNYALWYACAKDKRTILNRILALDPTYVNQYFRASFRHEHLNKVFGNNMTPLSVAIVAGHHRIVRSLLEKGADPNLCDRKPVMGNRVCRYPIHWAAASTHVSSVHIIDALGSYSADMNKKPWAKSGPDVFRPKGMLCAPIFQVLLLDKPVRHHLLRDAPSSAEQFDADLQTLHALRLEQLRMLLTHGADPNARYSWDSVTPVFFLLDSLDNYRPSFYFSDFQSSQPEKDAQVAIINKITMSFLDLLYAKGADIEALGHAVFIGDTARLIAHDFPEMPLHVACRLDDEYRPIIQWFLDHGAAINALGVAACTPLMAFCGSWFQDTDMLRRFLRAGAGSKKAVNHQNILGMTALHELCANQGLLTTVKHRAVRLLLACGADPTVISHEGRTPADEIDTSSYQYADQQTIVDLLNRTAQNRAKMAEKREFKEKKLKWARGKGKKTRKALENLNYEGGQKGKAANGGTTSGSRSNGDRDPSTTRKGNEETQNNISTTIGAITKTLEELKHTKGITGDNTIDLESRDGNTSDHGANGGYQRALTWQSTNDDTLEHQSALRNNGGPSTRGRGGKNWGRHDNHVFDESSALDEQISNTNIALQFNNDAEDTRAHQYSQGNTRGGPSRRGRGRGRGKYPAQRDGRVFDNNHTLDENRGPNDQTPNENIARQFSDAASNVNNDIGTQEHQSASGSNRGGPPWRSRGRGRGRGKPWGQRDTRVSGENHTLNESRAPNENHTPDEYQTLNNNNADTREHQYTHDNNRGGPSKRGRGDHWGRRDTRTLNENQAPNKIIASPFENGNGNENHSGGTQEPQSPQGNYRGPSKRDRGKGRAPAQSQGLYQGKVQQSGGDGVLGSDRGNVHGRGRRSHDQGYDGRVPTEE
ncbi:hypothetical protein GGR50DRAFT_562349 [Xylaria sp. CBS 124048]|nr:hypothetical protein GGR50DRAFT_562349 [Xylaria sp. CBS 124048]